MSQVDGKRNITWFFAFRTLLAGTGNRGLSGLKAVILVCALASPFVFGLSCFNYAVKFSGDLPPAVPEIKATGFFLQKIKKVGIHEVIYIEFAADSGQIFTIDRDAWFKGQGKLAQENPSRRLYVEGFLLKNGAGSFFSTWVSIPGGEVLLTRETAMKQLELQRSYKYDLNLLYLVILFWIISFVNIHRLKIKLSEGVQHGQPFIH
jgi:hypothetical protein